MMMLFLALATREVELPFTEVEETVSRAGLGGHFKSSVLDMFSLRTLVSIPTEVLN